MLHHVNKDAATEIKEVMEQTTAFHVTWDFEFISKHDKLIVYADDTLPCSVGQSYQINCLINTKIINETKKNIAVVTVSSLHTKYHYIKYIVLAMPL